MTREVSSQFWCWLSRGRSELGPPISEHSRPCLLVVSPLRPLSFSFYRLFLLKIAKFGFPSIVIFGSEETHEIPQPPRDALPRYTCNKLKFYSNGKDSKYPKARVYHPSVHSSCIYLFSFVQSWSGLVRWDQVVLSQWNSLSLSLRQWTVLRRPGTHRAASDSNIW